MDLHAELVRLKAAAGLPQCMLGSVQKLIDLAQEAAAIQSLLYTSKLNGLDPTAWLRETLEKLPACPN